MLEILRNLTRHKLRNILTISGIVIGVLALVTMGAMAEKFNALLDGGAAYFGSNIQIGSEGTDTFSGGSFLALSKIQEVQAVEGVWLRHFPRFR